MTNDSPLWLFIHLPKSGGTTLKTHLERYFRFDEELVEFSHWGRSHRRKAGRAEFADRPPEERAKAKMLAGHQVFFGLDRLVPDSRERRYFTFVRDPADRCISLYNFRYSRGRTRLPFDQWYEEHYLSRHRESMVRFFAERLINRQIGGDAPEQLVLARQLLERCWHVGTTPRLDESLSMLCAEMNIPGDWVTARGAGTSPPLSSPTHPDDGERIDRHFAVDTAVRLRIYADSPCDLELYRWAQTRSAIAPPVPTIRPDA